MVIFIDTNIFYEHYQVNGPHFRLLFNYIENSELELLISDLVIQEVDNNFRKAWEKNIDDIRKAQKNMIILSGEEIDIIPAEIKSQYSIKNLLKTKTNRVKFITYDHIPHSTVVSRAINVIRPFQENDKGYRDTLIWLSLLDYIKKNPRLVLKEVAVITKNINDFADKEGNFHHHLLNDLKEYGINTPKIYKSMQEFAEKKIPKDSHTRTHSELKTNLLNPIKSKIEHEATSTINEFSFSQLEEVSTNWNGANLLKGFVKSHLLEISDGIEDLEVNWYKEMPVSRIFVNCTFNLRRCSLSFTIPLEHYITNKRAIDNTFDNIQIDNDEVILYLFVRTYLESSITLNTESTSIESFSVNRVEFH